MSNRREDEQPHSRGAIAPGFCVSSTLERKRAQGMPGEGLTHGPPATKKAGGSHHGFSQINRHSPRNGFNGVVLRGDRTGDRAFLPPSSARSSSRQLGISVGMPGPHDFAVRND